MHRIVLPGTVPRVLSVSVVYLSVGQSVSTAVATEFQFSNALSDDWTTPIRCLSRDLLREKHILSSYPHTVTEKLRVLNKERDYRVFAHVSKSCVSPKPHPRRKWCDSSSASD